MDFKTIKKCFQLFKKYMMQLNNDVYDDNIPNRDIRDISIEEINHLTQTLFMKHIINCKDNIRLNSVPVILYRHMNTIIKQYYETNKLEIIDNFIEKSPLKNNVKLDNNTQYWFF